MRRLSVIVLMCLCLSSAWSAERYPFSNSIKKTQFDTLTHTFRCLVCQNEDLAASQASLAVRLKDQLYEMVNQGMSSKQIKSYMVHRYGDFVMLKPPLVARTALLWMLPIVFLLFGFFLIWRMSCRRKEH